MNRAITILSIDDEESIRFALGAVIESQGWNAIMASDAIQGVEMFKKVNPDLVLIDYHMPRINGIEGVKMLRKLSDTVPIIVFTIDENQDIANKFIEAGASDFATKPIKAPDIISRINLHIRLLQSNLAKERADAVTQSQQGVKGIGAATLDLIKDALLHFDDYVTVEEIAGYTGLAYQTTYRYLQHLSNEGTVDVKSTYGKVGRPKQGYKLNL
ncbi:MAG: response regulator [Oscillospiraceae bacterium]